MSDEVLNALDAVPAAETPTKQKKVPTPGTPEFLAYKRLTTRKSRKKSKEKQSADSPLFNSQLEPTKAEAKKILEGRGLRNPHVIDVCYDLALRAAEEIGVPANRFLFAHGIRKMLESYEQKSPQLLEAVVDEPVIGELSTRPELVCLHDFSIGFREDAVSFEEFLRLRRVAKTGAYELSMMLGKDFELSAQGEWFHNFLPRWNPDTLPAHYTQREMRDWLDAQSETKDYLLLASRNSMKSSASLVFLLTLHLTAPDARALLCSETKKLSAGFIRSYRSYWERKPNAETFLTKYFPEYCIEPGEGSILSFESPMAHLDLIASSAEATSAESATTGSRCDLFLADDIISDKTTGTEEQCQKSIDTFDLLQKLREVSGSFSITVGTPWRAEIDLYATMIKRNSADVDKPLAIRIDPIVTVRKEARHKLTPLKLTTLVPEDVERYLLPVRMPWKFVIAECRKSPSVALSQNFCVFPNDADAELRCTFTEQDLRAATRPIGAFDKTVFSRNVAALDRAFSVAKTADYSALCCARTLVKDHRPILAVLNVPMDRVTESGLVEMCTKYIIQYDIQYFVLERDKGHEQLILAIRRALMLRGHPSPEFRAVGIASGPRNRQSKAKRVKTLELPLHDGRLFFAVNENIDAIYQQFCRYDGLTNSGSSDGSKDDIPDAVSLCYENFMPKDNRDIPDADLKAQKEKEEAEEKERRRQDLRRAHESMFGGVSAPQPPLDDTPVERPADDRRAMLSKILPPGMRA